MKYISTLIPPTKNLDYLKYILESDIEIDFLNFNFLGLDVKKYKNFDELLIELNFFLKIKNSKIGNFDSIKKEIEDDLSSIATEYAIQKNEFNDNIKYYILKNPQNIYKYCKHIGNIPFEGSDETMFYFYENYYKIKKESYITDVEPLTEYIKNIYIPNQKKVYPDTYIERFTNDKLDLLIKGFSRNIYDILNDLYERPLPKWLIEKIISININKKTHVIISFLDSFYKDFKSSGLTDDQIYNSIFDQNGEYNFIYKKLISLKDPDSIFVISNLFSRRCLPELEDILLRSNADLIVSYLILNFKDIYENTNIDKFLKRLEKSPLSIIQYLKSIPFFKIEALDIRVKKIAIKSSPLAAFKYFKEVIRKWSFYKNYPNDSCFLLKDDIEEEISKLETTSIDYLKMVIKDLKSEELKIREIRNKIDSDFSKIKKAILDSNIPYILYDYANLLKEKLSPRLEEIIKNGNDTSIYPDYLKIKFIK
jgi:hypothetical protein